MYASGNWSTTAGLSAIFAPPIGTSDIDSSPPASPASMLPAAMRSAMIAVDCSPDEQKRLMVIAGHLVGQAGEEADLAGDVQALLGLRVRAAEDDVLDDRGVDLGAPDRFAADERPPDRRGGCS